MALFNPLVVDVVLQRARAALEDDELVKLGVGEELCFSSGVGLEELFDVAWVGLEASLHRR